MLRLTLIADPHCRGDDVHELAETRKLLRLTSEFAIAHQSNVVCLGDFFHKKNVLDPVGPVILEAHSELQWAWDRGCMWMILMGNHDTNEPDNIGHSVLQLFCKVAIPILIPRAVVEDNVFLGLLPWAPPAVFRAGANMLTKQAMDHRGTKILFSHVSLQEGHVSPSNQRVQSPIRVHDLHPSEWNVIYLGDYHAAQQVAGLNVYYLGAPRPQAFNDYDNIGIWLLEVNDGSITLTPHRLSESFPQFRSYQVRSELDLPLPGYSSDNKNRVYVNLELKNRVRTLYPDAQCRPLAEDVIVMQESRIGVEEASTMSPLQIVDRWRQARGLPEQPYTDEAKTFIEGGQ